MNALSKTKCTRLLVAFGLCLLLAGPAVLLWASRVQLGNLNGDEDAVDLQLRQMDAMQATRIQLPAATLRPAEFSVFGPELKRAVRVPGDAPGMLRTNLGDLDPRNPNALLHLMPADLRFADNELSADNGKGRLNPHGINYVMLDRKAIDAKGLDAVLEGIRRDAKIIDYRQNGTLVVYVEQGQAGRLHQNPDVAVTYPSHPADKIDINTGRKPFQEKARATDTTFRLEVALVPRVDVASVKDRLAKIAGVVDVLDYGYEGSSLLVRADHKSLGKIARVPEVMSVAEAPEYDTLNAKNSPTIQVGSAEDGQFIRAFDDAGVDGGGIDTNGDGQRINNGTDTVPPQIVGVIDNGISADTASFSQTATTVTDLAHTFLNQAQRKIHSIIPVHDNGDDCDSTLDGAGSHGNIVASVIAAYPSQLGVFATRSGVGGPGQPRNANLDGVARGARIIVSDVADRTRCTTNSLVERGGNVDPGSLSTRLNELICPKSGGGGICLGLNGGAGEVHLAVTPFGLPDNFSTTQFLTSNGTYPLSASDVDTFLYNNKDFMVVAPTGNSGGLIGANRWELALDVLPDLFDGTDTDDCAIPCSTPNPHPIQVAPPATAKNIVAVGVSRSDCVTFFGTSDCETRTVDFSSRGPATPESLRMAPILMAPGSDLVPSFETASIAVFRSRDDNNIAPIDNQIDEGNFGTSYSAANVTGAAAIIRDYFAQGFYPTGSRVDANRVANVSGALVKAALVASAKFETRVETQGQGPVDTVPERNLRRTRGMDMGTISGVDVGVMGNSEQGYGRPVLTQVLPLANWSKNFVLNPNAPSTPEHPARGLLVWDDMVSGEPAINNTTNTSKTHTFKVASPRTTPGAGGGLAVLRGELRIALAWTDPPSAPDSGGPLVNDLDLVLEGPGPDNCLGAGDIKYDGTVCAAGTEADNRFYDGNVYNGGNNNAQTDQFSKVRPVGGIESHDKRNPQEGIHINSDPNQDRNFTDSTLFVGTWRVTVKRGAGGFSAGSITITGPNEDINGNRRLDPGEDTNGNLLLDLGGQTYALVVSGPVFLGEAPPAQGPSSFPASGVTMDKIRYFCSDSAVATIFDSTAGAGTARSTASTTFTVRNAAGATVDTEQSIGFVAGATAGSTSSNGVPVRLGATPVANNGVLEVDTGMQVVATYAPAGQAAVSASAQVQCSPNFIPGFFAILGNNSIGPQYAIDNGCDADEYFDAGETLTYGIALTNRGRGLIGGDDYSDVVATLTPSGPGAGAIRVLDSPRNVGRIPPNAVQGVYFHVFVDPTLANALAIANRSVTLTLNLDSLNKGQRIDRQSYAFTHAINADKETFHYSTDHPAGGREVRDLNRNLVIDKADQLDPFKLFFLPDEDVNFATMFTPGVTISGTPTVTNILGEDLNNNGTLDSSEFDYIPDGVLERGILFSSTGITNGADKIPFNFDSNNGGWVPVRHPASTPNNISANPLWEYKTNGLCGFQTDTGIGHYGIWHTGDGNPATPPNNGTACDNFAIPSNPATEAMVEMVFDVLHSPIIAKVHQEPDARGFSYGVEFQRLGLNLNDQVNNGAYTGGGINIDNNLDNDSADCLLCQELDPYYTRRGGGWPYNVFALSATSQYFDTGSGIDPHSTAPFQRTFGPRVDTDGSLSLATPTFTGDEKGFSAFTQNTNSDSSSPIPQAPPDLLKFPQAGAPVPGVCTNGPTPGAPCQVDATCGTGGTCAPEVITDAGPIRNFETTLVGFEGGFATETLAGTSAPEDAFFFNPGPAGNRWEIGIGFYAMENQLPADYGFGIDDVVFEWDESHPLDESAFVPAHAAACARFNTPGNPAGGQCATITVDRTNLYECEEALEISVVDPKLPANTPSVNISIVTDSDADIFSTSRFTVLRPNSKVYPLAAVAGQQGLFRGTVPVSTTTNNSTNVFTNAGTDAQFIVYYVDPNCDGDRDGQAGEVNFSNIDGDGVAFNVDNCPLTYNPLQEDADGDGVGNLCDNCVNFANSNQADTNNDGVGDACEFDDVDGDGTENGSDNCPDVYNPSQDGHCTYTPTAPTGPCQKNADCTGGTLGVCDLTRGFDCSSTTADRDADGRVDASDNCVLSANGNQRNTDGDALGDQCDADCNGVTVIHICSNAPATTCTSDTDCPAGGHCQPEISHSPSAICSTVDDDADVDGVEDSLDNCADIYNPTIIPGTKRQLDSDRDGVGDACDPAGSADDDLDGVPDDIVSFQGTIACRFLPLASFALLDAAYQDLDGDHDPYPDTGETGRVRLTLQNTGPALTGASFTMTSSDPDVGCITSPTVLVGNVAAGAQFTVGSLDPLQPGFQFRASNSLDTVRPANPAKIDLCVAAVANETLGMAAPLCFSLAADLDIPVVTQVFINGPDNIPNTGDDGLLLENFDTDADGDGHFSVNDTFRITDAGTGLTYHGSYVHGSPTGVGTDVVAGTACGGFTTVGEGNPACVLDPDFPMDWHIHCAATGPGALLCDNSASGGGINGNSGCVGGCSYNTPANDQRSFDGSNSLHLGAHFDLNDALLGDTTHFRALQAFVSSPINLALFPRPGDLEMNMYHIVDLMDNNGVGPGNTNQCVDCADVQISVDFDEHANVDEWGPWDKLVPFANVYDHKMQAWSVFGGYYCQFTPTDTGTAAPAPRGVHETMCYPLGMWSHCGSTTGTSAATTFQCPGPGIVDASGQGVWVQSRFNLKSYQGSRVRIRWIANTWTFDAVNSSYFETGPGWSDLAGDDGWWLDHIQVTGVINQQLSLQRDTRPAPATSCPATAADNCNENAAASDKGTNPQLKVTDLSNNLLDGVSFLAITGAPLRVSAIDSTLPGTCANGVTQYRFSKDGVLAQDWSSKDFLQDTPTKDANYSVLVRCSSDFTCTSQVGATASVKVYTGDGADISLSVSHDRNTGITTLSWPSRPQPSPMAGYDAFRGTQTDDGSSATPDPPDSALATLTSLTCHIAQVTPIGTTMSTTTSLAPATNQVLYFLVGHRNPTAGAKDALGQALFSPAPASVEVSPINCP